MSIMQSVNLKRKQEEIEKYYDGYIKRQSKVGINQRHRSILDKLKTKGLKNNHRVLEIGCGIGTFTSLIANEVTSGTITAMDISGESINHAKRSFDEDNVEFIHADAANFDFKGSRYDVVVLPDVIEHIPIELHEQLFEKLEKVLDDKGFIFIHIPNPYYLQWCHENRPDLLQVIDQPITTDVLIKNIYPNGLFIEELKSYSIWVKDNDYQHIVLRKNGYQDFTKVIDEKLTFFQKLKHKINALFK